MCYKLIYLYNKFHLFLVESTKVSGTCSLPQKNHSQNCNIFSTKLMSWIKQKFTITSCFIISFSQKCIKMSSRICPQGYISWSFSMLKKGIFSIQYTKRCRLAESLLPAIPGIHKTLSRYLFTKYVNNISNVTY